MIIKLDHFTRAYIECLTVDARSTPMTRVALNLRRRANVSTPALR